MEASSRCSRSCVYSAPPSRSCCACIPRSCLVNAASARLLPPPAAAAPAPAPAPGGWWPLIALVKTLVCVSVSHSAQCTVPRRARQVTSTYDQALSAAVSVGALSPPPQAPFQFGGQRQTPDGTQPAGSSNGHHAHCPLPPWLSSTNSRDWACDCCGCHRRSRTSAFALHRPLRNLEPVGPVLAAVGHRARVSIHAGARR